MKSCLSPIVDMHTWPLNQKRKAVFLDKDGTLVDDVPYNVNPALIRLTNNAVAGLRALSNHGYILIVISNQSGVARGYFPELALLAVERRLTQLVAAASVHLTDMYYCPHHPHGTVSAYAKPCGGRKPAPGLLARAAHEYNIAMADSWFVGDILDDIEAGRRAGCRTVLLHNGHETKWRMSPLRYPHAVAADLQAAAKIIVERVHAYSL